MTHNEPATVLQALIARLNPLTPDEAIRDVLETLTRLVAAAATQGHGYPTALATALRDAHGPIYEAMQGIPHAARQSALQGVQAP